MNQDQLYLIKHDFVDDGQTYYCPECVELIGLLEIYPQLKSSIVIHTVDFARPRPKLVKLLGEENQGCPLLILAKKPQDLPAHLKVLHAKGHDFIAGARKIGDFLAHIHGIGAPH